MISMIYVHIEWIKIQLEISQYLNNGKNMFNCRNENKVNMSKTSVKIYRLKKK